MWVKKPQGTEKKKGKEKIEKEKEEEATEEEERVAFCFDCFLSFQGIIFWCNVF